MKLLGEEVAVDCMAQRDRAWGPRRDNRQPRVAYVYGATSSTNAFLAVSAQKKGGPDNIFTGYYMHEGTWAKMVSGRREVDRDALGRVAHVRIDGTDELGRSLQVEGETVSRLFITAYPSMVVINSLTRFVLNGEECWGEDQDTWSPRRWRDFKATLRAARDDGYNATPHASAAAGCLRSRVTRRRALSSAGRSLAFLVRVLQIVEAGPGAR